jgi:hypothetical protein
MEESVSNDLLDSFEDDLNDFDWEKAKGQNMNEEEGEMAEEIGSIDDLLGDFLSSMNK